MAVGPAHGGLDRQVQLVEPKSSVSGLKGARAGMETYERSARAANRRAQVLMPKVVYCQE